MKSPLHLYSGTDTFYVDAQISRCGFKIQNHNLKSGINKCVKLTYQTQNPKKDLKSSFLDFSGPIIVKLRVPENSTTLVFSDGCYFSHLEVQEVLSNEQVLELIEEIIKEFDSFYKKIQYVQDIYQKALYSDFNSIRPLLYDKAVTFQFPNIVILKENELHATNFILETSDKENPCVLFFAEPVVHHQRWNIFSTYNIIRNNDEILRQFRSSLPYAKASWPTSEFNRYVKLIEQIERSSEWVMMDGRTEDTSSQIECSSSSSSLKTVGIGTKVSFMQSAFNNFNRAKTYFQYKKRLISRYFFTEMHNVFRMRTTFYAFISWTLFNTLNYVWAGSATYVKWHNKYDYSDSCRRCDQQKNSSVWIASFFSKLINKKKKWCCCTFGNKVTLPQLSSKISNFILLSFTLCACYLLVMPLKELYNRKYKKRDSTVPPSTPTKMIAA